MGKIIAVVSGKGGTGKTTAVGALSACLGALGKRTVCVDCDADLHNLDITLGVTDYVLPPVSPEYELPDDLYELCLPHPSLRNLWFFQTLDFGKAEDDDRFYRSLFSRISEEFDYCLLDAPAGIGPDVLHLLDYADEALIVTTADRSSIRDGQVMCSRLQDYGLKDIRLLVNRVQPRLLRLSGNTVDDIIDTVGARLLGIVREDRDVSAAANKETPLILFSSHRAACGFRRIARRLTGETVPISTR